MDPAPMPLEVTLAPNLTPIRASTPEWRILGSVPFLPVIIPVNHTVIKEAWNFLSNRKAGIEIPGSPQLGQLFRKPVNKTHPLWKSLMVVGSISSPSC